MERPPALILSLDFEILWGVRDHVTRQSPYARNLLGVREAVPGMLALFRRHEVAATWATVGLLFASTRAEQQALWPEVQPGYRRRSLDAYQQDVGPDEAQDPYCFGADLLRLIQGTPRQEIGTHTFCHYFCREEGQTGAEFAADLAAAGRAARAFGVDLRSLVFPRNQVNESYLPLLSQAGLSCFRDLEPNWGNRHLSRRLLPLQRIYRLLDTYVNLSGPNSVAWPALSRGPLARLPASRFLRPCTGRRWLDELQWRRVEGAMARAAQRGEVFHLWWHPHNFGRRTQANLDGLDRLLTRFGNLRQRYGMVSLTMAEAAERALA